MTLSDLITRVESATGPDREIDAAVAEVVLGWRPYQVADFISSTAWFAKDGERTVEVPLYTASIDAVEALIRREMPAFSIVVSGPRSDGRFWGEVGRGYAEAATPALALLLAFLRAVEARKTEKCELGVGCDEYGVCYAEAAGRPEACGRLRTKEDRKTGEARDV